jgi:hypothetical protein
MRQTLIVAALGVAVVACDGGAATARWRADSARYEAELRTYLRDSTTIDSIARTIDTRRLLELQRKQLVAKDPASLFSEVLCERVRLGRRYGTMPARIAVRGVEETVRRPDGGRALREMEARLPRQLVLRTDPRCRQEPRVVDTTTGLPLDHLFLRPVPPRRPHIRDRLRLTRFDPPEDVQAVLHAAFLSERLRMYDPRERGAPQVAVSPFYDGADRPQVRWDTTDLKLVLAEPEVSLADLGDGECERPEPLTCVLRDDEVGVVFALPQIDGDAARVGVKVLGRQGGSGTLRHTHLELTLQRQRGDWVVVSRRPLSGA